MQHMEILHLSVLHTPVDTLLSYKSYISPKIKAMFISRLLWKLSSERKFLKLLNKASNLKLGRVDISVIQMYSP